MNNPIVNKDASGLLALKIGLGVVFWNLSVGGGITVGTTDDDGYSFGPYLDLGPEAGVQVSGPQVTAANLPEQYAITTGLSASGGSGLYGVEVSKNETYYPYSKKRPETSQEASVGSRGGLSAGNITEFYLPVLTWGNNQRSANGPVAGAAYASLNSNSSTDKSSPGQNMSRATSGNISASALTQVLNQLSSLIQQLSAILSTQPTQPQPQTKK
jgi:hypothetical protein